MEYQVKKRKSVETMEKPAYWQNCDAAEDKNRYMYKYYTSQKAKM